MFKIGDRIEYIAKGTCLYRDLLRCGNFYGTIIEVGRYRGACKVEFDGDKSLKDHYSPDFENIRLCKQINLKKFYLTKY